MNFKPPTKRKSSRRYFSGKFLTWVGTTGFLFEVTLFRTLQELNKLSLRIPLRQILIHAGTMVFACQVDSFQRSLTSKVKSCEKGENEEYYQVICEDSILFPEGGGQPWDTGYLNNVPVHQVLRRGTEAVMYIKEPFKVGEEVKQVVDWERRFDHMQQHSGQHLITAIINSEYKIDTTSWWLGEKISHIELNTKQLKEEQISNIENLVNRKILEQVPVVVKLCELGDKALDNARTRGLPDDVAGPIRIVEIVGIEDDLCCGTHVTNLSQLQCIKLLYAEKGKKDKTNLFFLSGGRVLQYLGESLKREVKLTKLLKNEPASHPDLVEKLQQNLKISKKKLSGVVKDLAVYDAKKFKELSPQPKFFCNYNKDGDTDYLDSFIRTIMDGESNGKTLFVLASGEEKGNGNLVMLGEKDIIEVLGPKVAELLGGKGAVHGTRFQAKVSNLINFKKAETVVNEYFSSLKDK